MTYYKVVCAASKKLYSAVLPYHFTCAQPIRYVKNKWTKPKIKNSKLFVYDDLDRALEFASLEGGRVVYECKVKNPVEQTTISKRMANLTYITPKEFWKTFGAGFDKDETWKSKTVNIYCDEVKIIKRV